MIAKIVTAGPDRETALERLAVALEGTRVAGLETNTRFLHALATEPDFVEGKVSTAFIDEHRESLFARADDDMLARAAAALWLDGQSDGEPDPWSSLSNWRSNQPATRTLGLATSDGTDVLELTQQNGTFTLRSERQASAADRRTHKAPGETRSIHGHSPVLNGQEVRFGIGEETVTAVVAPHRSAYRVWIGIDVFDIAITSLASTAGQHKSAEGSLEAPMPGVVVALSVAEGDTVQAGDTLLILEAMKMEHQVHAPSDGVVKRVLFAAGAQVREGDTLVELAVAD